MKMMKRLFTLILFFTAVTTTATHAQQTGTVTGTVYDSDTGEPLIGAAVSVDGMLIGTTTDAKGNFTLQGVPAGRHNITISYLGYAEAKEAATVGNRTVFKVEIYLHSQAIEVGEVVVIARLNRESESGLLAEQKEALVVVQTVGASEMSRKGTGDAEAAVAQVSGVSKQDGAKNVFVRGLGDRYNRTLLNGFPVPSEDPEYKNIALEFFATDIIKNIVVAKVFTADNNGDVGGAVIDINSKELSGTEAFSVGIDAGANNRAAGATMLRPDGVDFFGKSNNRRPTDGKFDFANKMQPRRAGVPLNNGFGISGGKRFLLGENEYLSFFAVANHGTDYSYSRETVREIDYNGVELRDQTGEKSAIGISQLVLANADYRTGENQAAYNFMLLHSNEQYVGRYYGEDAETYQGSPDYVGCLWRQQSNDNLLIANQLMGKFRLTGRLQTNLGVSYNTIRGTEPDRRENNMSHEEGDLYYLTLGNGRQKRFFSELHENDINLRANLRWALSRELDIEKSNVTAGYQGRFTDNDFKAINYSMDAVGGYFDIDALDLDRLYNEANFEAGQFDINRSAENYYNVLRNTHSLYAEASHLFTDKFAANIGVQTDIIHQNMDYYVDAHGKGKTNMRKTYLLPNLNLRYALTELSSLRLAASKSYILPQAKEIAPYQYVNVGFASEGDVDLKPSDCYNIDLKWDYFPTPAELLSVGVFYKHIVDPMGRINKGESSNALTYANLSPAATVAGVELEVRKNLFEAANTGKLAAGLNASYIYSNLELDVPNTAKRKTELEGASPFILNGDVTYSLARGQRNFVFSLVANYTSDRINDLGTRGYFDTIEKGVVILNAVSSYKFNEQWTVKLKAGNLLDPSFKLTQAWGDGGRKTVLNEYKKGIDVSLGISFSI
jgi:hypothetical protein